MMYLSGFISEDLACCAVNVTHAVVVCLFAHFVKVLKSQICVQHQSKV